MHSRILSITVGVVALLSFPSWKASAQSTDGIRKTWNGPDSSMIMSLLKNRKTTAPKGAARQRTEVTFQPSGDSGVAKSLADAFGRNAEEKAALVEAFEQIKQGYETEIAKAGKSNNLAAAMTFFIGVNVATYHRAEMPSDAASENLFISIQETMAGLPAFARLSNLEKQQMHDWLVTMAGFVMSGTADAKQSGDQQALNSFREFADYSMRLVLGVEVGKMSFRGDNLSIEGGDTAMAGGDNALSPTSATDNKVVGVWSKSASSPTGLAGTIDGTQKMMTNVGYYKGQYEFKADGTYTFKGESWGGYLRSNEFWTTEESGAYSVNGDSLTVAPRSSKKTLRNRDGVIQKSQNNQLEKVTYKWRLHYFEGLNQTNLILQATQETIRDGGFSGNSLFPKSFLYGPGPKEWRF